MKSTTLNGQLEIDHDRGVIYFHLSEEKEIEKRGTVTLLRICSLPTPIPDSQWLDITWGHMVSWRGKE